MNDNRAVVGLSRIKPPKPLKPFKVNIKPPQPFRAFKPAVIQPGALQHK